MQTFSWWLLIALLAAALIVLGVMVYRSRWHMARLSPNGRELYVSCSMPDYAKAAGIQLETLPQTEFLIPHACWLVNGSMAEIEYSIIPAQRAWLRLAPSGQLACADACRDIRYENSGTYEVNGITVQQQQITGGLTMLQWSQGGYDFMFYAPSPPMGALGGLVGDLVQGIRVTSSQSR